MILKYMEGHRSLCGTRLLVMVLVMSAALCVLPHTVSADDLVLKNFHYFRPPADGSGILFTYGSEALSWWGMHYGGYVDDSINHLNVVLENDEEVRLMENQIGFNALYAVGITQYLNIGVGLPFVPYRWFNDEYDIDPDYSTVVEDLRLDVKGILFDRRRRCFGLALNLTGTSPVDWRDNTFVTDGGMSLTTRLIADLGREWWTVALNGGYRLSRGPDAGMLNMEVGDEALFSLGAIFRLRQYGQILLDTSFRTPINEFFTEDGTNYGEVLAGYRYFFGTYSTLALTVGGGTGLLGGAGSPTGRFFLGITVYEHRLEKGR